MGVRYEKQAHKLWQYIKHVLRLLIVVYILKIMQYSLCFFNLPFRSSSNAGLKNKVVDADKQAELMVLFNPEKIKEQMPKVMDQGKITENKGQQLHKDTSTEKIKESDSSLC